ncbi:MAG: hypothetical protein K9H16_03435 [Bacteroidales bacterium]|nr:hypothetical protein [Bacteroidales bacterium]
MKIISVYKIAFMLIIAFVAGNAHGQKFYKTLQGYANSLPDEFDQIPAERQEKLKEIGDYMFGVWTPATRVRPLFVCTHNSRRSQMSQVWMQAAGYFYGVTNVVAASGGTEATAFNKRAVAALERAGFRVHDNKLNPDNPSYILSMGKRYESMHLFSKKYDDGMNPHHDFFAVMVCSDADKTCPVVDGADERFSLPYDDPRFSDNTASEEITYDERCRQIAREMFFIMDHVKKQFVLKLEKSRK